MLGKHMHEWKEEGDILVCTIPECTAHKLKLEQTEQEGMLQGKRKNGIKYGVRKNRKSWLLPEVYLKLAEMGTQRFKDSLKVAIMTGARHNEFFHIEHRDCDFDRNTITLRVTKSKARKQSEQRSQPRTIPISSQYMKELKKYFKDKPMDARLNLLSNPAFNIGLKENLKKLGVQNYFMYSVHNIRKTHGNWLKLLSSAQMINCDATEICLRLGHDYNTFLSSYGSSSSMNPKDLLEAKQILGDLYAKN